MDKKSKFVRRKFHQETFFHSYLVRPLAQEVVALVWNTPITPNQMTIFRILLNISSLYCVVRGQFLWAFLLFQTHEIIDHADGMLARMKNIKSDFGATMEVTSDMLFSAAFGFLGFSYAWSGYRLESNHIYFVFYGLIAMSYCYGSYFRRFITKNEGVIHANHDVEDYIPLWDKTLGQTFRNWGKTAFTWQNQFFLWGGLLYYYVKPYGYNTLMIAFVIVLLLLLLYWILPLIQIYKKIFSRKAAT